MSSAIELFCLAITDKALLTEQQCNIVKAICAPNATIDDFISLTQECGLETDPDEMAKIKSDVTLLIDAESIDAPSTPDPEDEEVTAKNDYDRQEWNISPELDWFCFFGVSQGLFDANLCLSLVSGIEGATNLLPFAQTLIETGLCDDYVTVQDMVRRSTQQAQTPDPPPFSIFSDF